MKKNKQKFSKVETNVMYEPDAAIHEVVEEPVIARTITLAPDSFNDARQIGEEFRSGATVMINLQSLDAETKRRLVDYMSGLAHGIDGKFTKIAMNVFMLEPKNVEVRH